MPLAIDGRKVCSKCRVEKPVTDYTPSKTASDRLQSWCKPCVAAKALAYWNGLTYEQQLERCVTRHYGITGAEYLRLLEEQDHLCAICRQPETRIYRGKPTRLVVDHDHTTGRVRGLLCHDCNVGIAKLKDDPLRLLRAADYLIERTDDGLRASSGNGGAPVESG